MKEKLQAYFAALTTEARVAQYDFEVQVLHACDNAPELVPLLLKSRPEAISGATLAKENADRAQGKTPQKTPLEALRADITTK